MLDTGRNIAILGLVVALLGACKTFPLDFQGRRVAEEHRILLGEGQGAAGDWQTRDLKINYKAFLQQGSLTISGELIFADHLVNGYRNIFLTMGIDFMDGDQRIIARRPFPLVRYSIYRRELAFSQRFAWPEGAVGFTFDYTGRAWEGGRLGGGQNDEAGGMDWTFWHTP